MKHKHAELIKAWADGAEIEVKNKNNNWSDVCIYAWNPDVEYRIKPEEKQTVVRYLWATDVSILSIFATEEEAAQHPTKLLKLEWSRTEFPK
jgi:hypothetical protein